MIRTGLLFFLKMFISLLVLKYFKFGGCVVRNIFTPMFYSSLTCYYLHLVCTNIVKCLEEDLELYKIDLLAGTFIVCTYNLYCSFCLIAWIHIVCTNIVNYVREGFEILRKIDRYVALTIAACLFEHARTCNAAYDISRNSFIYLCIYKLQLYYVGRKQRIKKL